ncbi:MAG: L-lactate dehydrogenase [Bifidobacterium sp.]|nr:L-lactate dehydrogenase [Bifidobacterium sp.]
MALIRKIGIIGLGHVGAHVANSLLMEGIADELYLADINQKKLTGEVQDLSDALSFNPHNCKIVNCMDEYEKLAGCDVIVNAAGDVNASAVSRDGELFITTDIARTFIARVTDAGFKGIWVSIANPCDVVCTEICRLSGCDPKRVIGTGTALDSARLRNAIASKVGLDQHSINAYMMGEHGASQFAVFSAASFGGKPLEQLAKEQPDRFGFDQKEVENLARQGGYVTMAGKHCTEYAVANAAAMIVQAIVSNSHFITACSTMLDGEYGHSGHFASVPCVIGVDGIEEVINLELNNREKKALDASCEHISSNIARLGDWWNTESRAK